MPNFITNAVSANPETLNHLKGDNPADFNSIYKRPPSDDKIYNCTVREVDGGGEGYGPGYSPLDWARENWGTKWNAINSERLREDLIVFDTAWTHPFPIITELSKRCPEDTIYVQYADENTGYNCGYYKIKAGVTTSLDEDWTPRTQLEVAGLLRYGKEWVAIKREQEVE